MRQVDALEFGVGDICGFELCDQPTLAQDADMVGDLERVEEIVRRHQNGHAPCLGCKDALCELVGCRRVKARGRLVEEHRRGPAGPGNGQADLLPHALGVNRHPAVVRVAGQAAAVEQGPGLRLGQRDFRQRAEIPQVSTPDR